MGMVSVLLGASMYVEFVEKVVVKENLPKKKDWIKMELF